MKDKEKNEGLSAFEAEKIRSKYTNLIQDVIVANINFPDEIKDCVLSSSMIEKIMFEFEYNFLILEFGLCLNDFPEEFQKACIALHEEFHKDFPYASVVDTSKKNSYIITNYRSPLHFIYFMAEYDQPREIIKEVTNKLIEKYQLTPVLQRYKVIAKNTFFEQEYRVVLMFYIRKFNSYPCILMSRPIPKPISEEGLRKLEDCYEEIVYVNEWGNEVEYERLVDGWVELSDIVPELTEGLRYGLILNNNRYKKLVFSDEIQMPELKNYYDVMPYSQELIDHDKRMRRLMNKFSDSFVKTEPISEPKKLIDLDLLDDDDELPF
jgi:hypothetical protein